LFVHNSFGVSNEIFTANKKAPFKIFGEEVTEERFNDVNSYLRKNVDFTKHLKDQNPEVLEYIKLLKEFNKTTFKIFMEMV
jgi:hypothetical protein